MNSNVQFGDKEMLGDALSTQKFTTSNYNTSANECACASLKSEFMNILSEEHQIQHEIFNEMQKRGWYPIEQADQNKVMQAKQKFQNQMV